MNKLNIYFILLLLISFGYAQENKPAASVEKNFYGFQIGLVSIYFQDEMKLERKLVLHTEIGLELGTSVLKNDVTGKSETTTVFAPIISAEPRWYYGLDRRQRLGKNIEKNSSNYFSLKTAYISSDTPVIKNGSFTIVPSLQIIPKFGIRRVFSKHFNYEFSGGIGYQYNIFSAKSGCNCTHDDVGLDLQARIGYVF